MCSAVITVWLRPPCFLFANYPLPPALYSILIISSLSCPRVCCFLLVREHLFCSSDYLSAVVLADFVLLYFSSPVGLALFLHPFFYTLTCLYRTLVGSLPWFFIVRVLISSRHPSRSSLLTSSASPGSQRRLFIAFSPPLCPAGSTEAGLCSARRGSGLLANGECQLVDFWDWVFGFRCINTFLFFTCCWIPVSFLTYSLQVSVGFNLSFSNSSLAELKWHFQSTDQRYFNLSLLTQTTSTLN